MKRETRQAVSFAIWRPDAPSQVLVVQRPPDDEDLPRAWGLPAGRVHPGETDEDAVRRAGREKLGIELEVGAELNRGRIERPRYTLEMRLYAARIVSGEPTVPQPVPEVTQYVGWRWDEAPVLRPAADRGSLCCRLFLETESQ